MTARDLDLINLTAILTSLAMVIAPHAVHLPTWIPALVAVILLARFYFGLQHRKLPNKWLLMAVALSWHCTFLSHALWPRCRRCNAHGHDGPESHGDEQATRHDGGRPFGLFSGCNQFLLLAVDSDSNLHVAGRLGDHGDDDQPAA
jgi:hypothetical protein